MSRFTTLTRLLMPLSLLTACSSFHVGAMPGEPADATFARLVGTRVRFVDEGQGPAVVLVHGFASSLETWDAVRPALASGHRVVALDLKGFGWTDRPPGDYSPEAQADIVLALMDKLGVAEAALVGHSYGAAVVLALAKKAPARVTRIALYDAWVFAAQLPTFFHLARVDGLGEAMFSAWYKERAEDRLALAFHDPRFVTQALVDAVLKSLARPGTTTAALAAVRGMHFERSERDYPRIDKPALLLWGREDKVTPLGVGERLARELPRSRLIVYPGCGHFPMIEAAAASTRDLARFLDGGEP